MGMKKTHAAPNISNKMKAANGVLQIRLDKIFFILSESATGGTLEPKMNEILNPFHKPAPKTRTSKHHKADTKQKHANKNSERRAAYPRGEFFLQVQPFLAHS
jgi:hypothetical protein